MGTFPPDDADRTVVVRRRRSPPAPPGKRTPWLWWGLAGCGVVLCLALVATAAAWFLVKGGRSSTAAQVFRATPATYSFATATPIGPLAVPTDTATAPSPVIQRPVPTGTPSPLPPQLTPPSPTATALPSPTKTASVRPTATKVWRGSIAPVETANLIINYPDVLDPAEAQKHAAILQRAYDTYLALFGDGPPYGGKKIVMVFDPQVAGGATAGNPIHFAGKIGPNTFSSIQGQINPPGGGFYHEMVHDFIHDGQTYTPAAHYLCLNSAMNEAFASYFGYYFQHEVLKYSAADLAETEQFRRIELEVLAKYEARHGSPYGVAWSTDSQVRFAFVGMMFRVADRCGWGAWPKFFAIAKSSGNPGLAPEDVGRWGDMGSPTARKAFTDFVGYLSQACGQDLAPLFRTWGFDLPERGS